MDKKKVSSREVLKVVLKVVLNVLLAILALAVLAAVLYGGIRLLCFLGNYLYENYFFDIDYETSDVAQYGKFEFLPDEDYYQEYILPVFPKSIQPEFEDVIYDYRVYSFWGAGIKVYLEFSIRDPEKFDAFVQSTTQGLAKGTFHFDNAYEEYVFFNEDTGGVFDDIRLNNPYPDVMGQYYTVDYALILKVLVDRSQQRLIYIYIDISDCAFTTEDLDIYFSRFQIDPKEYEAYTKTIVPIPVPTTEEPEKTFEERVAHVLEKLKSGDFFKEIADNIWGDWEDTRYDYLNR